MIEKRLEEKSYVGLYKSFHIWRETYVEDEIYRTESYRYEDSNGNGRMVIDLEKLIRHLDALEARAAGRAPEPAVPNDHLPHGEDPGDAWVQTPEQELRASQNFHAKRTQWLEERLMQLKSELDDFAQDMAGLEKRLAQLRQDFGDHTDRIYNLETRVHDLEKRI